VALGGEDLADAARRLHYLTYLSRAAAEVLQRHRDALAEFARLRQASEEQSARLAALDARARADRDKLLAQRREHRRLFERVSGEVRDARRRVQAALADESRLSRLVEEVGRLIAARPGAGYARNERVPESGAGDNALFSALRGRLRLPVRGELAGKFGGQRSDGAMSSKGVFIRAPGGEQVRAVAAGRVVYADWMRGFGNLLIVDHGESYLSVYGNNDSLLKQPGDAVTLGEPLALVGASGGNEETGLYFELRHLGRPFDPLRWVKLK
jgi:septal ring factor EnvC (AmiA/AmiB activator)